MASKTKGESLEYWLLGMPNNGKPKETIEKLQKILEQSRCSEQYNLLKKIPLKQLRVGTLDKLIALSDELGRVDSFGKNLVQKLHKTYLDNENSTELLTIYGLTIDKYINSFKWDIGHYNPHTSLKDLVESINNNLLKTAEHLRKRTQTLNELNNNINIIERKKTGTLMNRDLTEYIDITNWINKEYITTALIVIPKNKQNEFENIYEFMEDTDANKKYEKLINNNNNNNNNNNENNENKNDNDNNDEIKQDINNNELNIKKQNCRTVVPNSCKILKKDDEFILYSVYLLKRGYNWFKYVCLQHGFNVRDFNLDNANENDDEKELINLKKDVMSKSKQLKLFCSNTFSESFSSWIHLKIIRVFVESVLRFGLPIDFTINAIKPIKNQSKKLLKILELKYQDLLDNILKKKKGGNENEVDYSGLSGEFYPFIYIPIKVEL